MAQAGTAPADPGTVVGADVSIRNLLGACVRLTRSGVPARATVVVLDRNLIDQLRAVGLPIDKLLVSCATGAPVGTPGTSGSSAGTGSGATSGADTSANGSGDPQTSGAGGPLAFTGAELAATLLLAGGLVALGMAFLRRARTLVPARATEPENA
ncbi:hypothetical protein BJ986_002955 [Phycicoccus badiiscoriae]|uniref:Uncharacterized protein n=1 Tax=Pedococcus badiiscoriae TaxID=642776 RepID=A0A852WHK7_9MICO|nr:hypothetical protein [Pedococcus badiiscoriae]NYG08468.1 hypothetical protein [Pedococcus badiiscoriae]